MKLILFNDRQLQINKQAIIKQRAITKQHRYRCNIDYNQL